MNWLEYLTKWTPLSGRFIKENGDATNIANVLGDAVDFTGTIGVIGEIHALGHKGIVFRLTSKMVIPASSTVFMVGETDGSTIHWNEFSITANEGGIEVFFLEDVIATGGTALIPVCMNRKFPKVSTFTITAGATVTNEGNTLELIGLPTQATPQTRTPLSGGDDTEWILKGASKYALKMVNLDAREKTLYGSFTWYEPELLGD
jgi:hypothetical protein